MLRKKKIFAMSFCRVTFRNDRRGVIRKCEQNVSTTSTVQKKQFVPKVLDPSLGRGIATFSVKKQAQKIIQELERPLSEYMSLPAGQYSVLDAEKVERLDQDTFRCYVGQIKMANFSFEPVLTLSVKVEDVGCTISLLECQILGGKLVQEANERFVARMTNVVRYDSGDAQSINGKSITSNTQLEVQLIVPNWFILPVGGLEGMGNTVMQGVLNTMVPRFLEQLRVDYELWASGDDSRKPIGKL
eukprot:TRINITY_DN32086_c0_g1_i1.p2 TRINITY_DN32086_c0_g1~~TRINITY_DN32086_c0_g1_i1.p2  ORF type:complete len:244 (+),score=29.09 TRINITY_DN32086_c0_g1_i1:128-859(+)